MNKIKLFGALEHVFFYIALLLAILSIVTGSLDIVYAVILFLLLSVVSHVVESKLEKKGAKKIFLGI
ncbi:MAG: hypothetical protein ACE5J7_03130 [Candidatus Aenigmatarchaeota archaeon]